MCDDGSPARQQVLHTFANDDVAAENNISDLIENWREVSAYWIMRVSEQPIKLTLYNIKILTIYSNHSKTIKLRVAMENPEEATDIFKAFSDDWKRLVRFDIISVTPIIN